MLTQLLSLKILDTNVCYNDEKELVKEIFFCKSFESVTKAAHKLPSKGIECVSFGFGSIKRD